MAEGFTPTQIAITQPPIEERGFEIRWAQGQVGLLPRLFLNTSAPYLFLSETPGMGRP